MLQSLMRSLFGTPKPAAPDRQRLTTPEWPSVIYAIGDVHGCLAELKGLEQAIYADGAMFEGDKWIVMLGDYVDRGPDSAGVLDHLMSPVPPGYRRICLAGNHETMMLAFLEEPLSGSDWLRFGGHQTLLSYAIDEQSGYFDAQTVEQRRQILDNHVPRRHVDFMRGLPVYLRVSNMVFVHAGLRHGVPLEQQSERDLLWLRPGDDAPFEPGIVVVHGHTPAATPTLSPWRIGIDTGAAMTGVLTSVRLTQHGDPEILQVGN
ncbi:MAG: serine/threonine protein phosphatase [Devosia sp.]|uniref:metallophosphoesterase family protein n=1 Tax=Devosia sp. TaxID=1871048 RepID=UPI0026243922|nr:metallophosphoesterase family protein [Devosia sp.]MDB5528484.1 serine/threonine protein phosphatase [Devosia sp.]